MYEQWATDQGIHYLLLRTLMALQLHSPVTQRQIAEAHAMPKQTVHNVIRRLLEQSAVELLPSDRDGREKLVALTETGREYARTVLDPLFDLDARIMHRLGAQRHHQLVQALGWYADAFEQQLEHENEPT